MGAKVVDRNYINFLQDRRDELSNLLWASRGLDLQVAYKQTQKPTPFTHKQAVLSSRKVQELIDRELRNGDARTTKTELLNQIADILEEIGYKKSLKLLRALGYALTKSYRRLNSGIFINHQTILNVRSQMGDCPLIFVPSHRSYADFIMMSYVLFTFNIEIPAIAAGMDFQGMAGMGTMLRNTGAFYMRRSYNNDSLYWTTFKEYVHQIIVAGDLPLEFFIEGTRSRSCKSLSPKFGLISMILRGFFLGEVPDILFVPINITYDRVLEEELFAYELLGVPKPKESTAGFFKSLKILKEKFGNIYFHCGEPISAKQFFGDKLDRSSHNVGPLYQQEPSDKEKQLIPPLAYEIVRSQQSYSVVTPFHLISLALYTNLSSNGELLSISQLIQEVNWLKEVLEGFGAFVNMPDAKESIFEALQVHKNKICLTKDNKIDLMTNKIILDKKNLRKFKAHQISDDIMSYSVPFILLQIYVNPLMHYLVDASLIVVILQAQKRLNREQLFTCYHFLRYLLSTEFVTYGSWEEDEFNKAVMNADKMGLLRHTEGHFELGDNEKLISVLSKSIESFLISYYNVCSVLLDGESIIDEKTVLKNVQMLVEKELRERKRFSHPYCLNLDTLTNCLSVFTANKALIKSRNNGSTFYEVRRDDLVEVHSMLGEFIPNSSQTEKVTNKIYLHNKL